MTDPHREPHRDQHERHTDIDSLARGLLIAGRSRKARSMLRMALPWLAAATTAVLGVIGGKMHTKEEMDRALEVRAELEALKRQQAELVSKIDAQLFSTDRQRPGRIIVLEKGQYFAWRALTEVRAATYAGQSAKRKAQMDTQAARFAIAFDKRAQHLPPEVAYDELFTAVDVP